MMRFSYREKGCFSDTLVWTEEIDGIGVPLVESVRADEFYGSMLNPVKKETETKTFRLSDLGRT